MAASPKNGTVNGYSTAKVRKALADAIEQPCAESACHWIAELVCSGKADAVWDVLIETACRTASTASPKVAVYLCARLEAFKRAVGHVSDNEIQRCTEARGILAEIAAILCQCRRQRRVDRTKIDTKTCFLVSSIRSKYRESEPITLETGDPVELLIPLSQLRHTLGAADGDAANALYWLEWCIAYGKDAKRRKKPCLCSPRSVPGVDPRHARDLSWLLWDVIVAATRSSSMTRVLESLRALYSSRFTPASSSKRWYIFYAAIEYVIVDPDPRPVLIRDPDVIALVGANVDKTYSDVAPERPISQSQSSSRGRSAEKLALLRRAEHRPPPG